MIGRWNNSGVIFGIYPTLLSNNYTGVIPTFQGPSRFGSISCSYAGTLGEDEGLIDKKIQIRASSKIHTTGVSSSFNYSNTSKFSLRWVVSFPTVPPAGSVFVAFRSGDGTKFNNFAILAGTDLLVSYGSNLATGNTRSSTPDFSTDTMYDVVVVKDQTITRIYINGEEVSYFFQLDFNMVETPPYTFDTGYVIGAQSEELASILSADYYLIEMYNKALSSTEILNLYNLGNDLGGLKGFDNGDGTMRVWYPYAVQDSLNKRLNKVEGATDVQNNISSATNVYTTRDGDVVAQKIDNLFN